MGCNNSRNNHSKPSGRSSMTIIWIVALAAIACLVYFIFGGGNKGSRNATSGKTPTQMPANTDTPAKQVTMVLDNSDSMKGYLKTSRFIDIVADIKGLTSCTQLQLTNGDTIKGDWIALLTNGNVAFTAQSVIADDIRLTAQLAAKGKSSLALLITDGIMSGSNEQIKQNPEYNKLHANELKNAVTQVLSDKAFEHLAVAVYQYTAPFSGTYYCYDNSKARLSNKMRNFYVIAIGQPTALAHYNHQIQIQTQKSDAQTSHRWLAIDRLPLNRMVQFSNPDVSFDPTAPNSPTFSTDREKLAKSKRNVELKLNLKQMLSNQVILPADFIARTSFTCSIDGVELLNTTPRVKGDYWVLSLDYNSIPKNPKKPVTIDLSISIKGNAMPLWTQEASCTDDKYMHQNPDARTFLLDKLLQGLAQGVPNNSGTTLYKEQIVIQ